MSDVVKSLGILIKTDTEMKGAEQAAAALEAQIGKAKALGETYDQLEVKLKRAQAAIGEYKNAISTASKAEADAAADKQANADAMTDAEASVINMTEKDVDVALKSTKATKGLTVSKEELHEAVKGLMMEFPELGHVAHLALNPIAFAVAGLTTAFAIWKFKVDGLTEALSEVKMPDLGQAKVSQVSAMAEAWNRMKDAVRDAVENLKSVGAQHDRHIKNLEEELSWEKQLLAVQKARDLAALEAKRPSMSDTEYQRRRDAVEKNYAVAGLKAEQRSDEDIIADRENRRDDLRKSAAEKYRQARAFRLPSDADAGRVAELDESYKSDREAAKKQLADARDRLYELADYAAGGSGNYLKRVFQTAKIRTLYGANVDNPERMADAQQAQRLLMESAQSRIDQADMHEHAQFQRQRQADRRKQLEDQAAKEAAEAAEIDLSLPEEKRHAARKAAIGAKVAGTTAQTQDIQRSTAEAATDLGQQILKAAQLAHDIASGKRKRYEMSPEEQEFMKGMDRGMTGARSGGSLDQALDTFGGAFANPDRMDQLYGRMNSVSTLKSAGQSGRDMLEGKQLDEAHKELLLRVAALLQGHTASLKESAQVMERVAENMVNRNELEAAIAKLNARMNNMDTRFGSQVNRN